MTPNVLVTCSKSGKLTSSLMEYYLDKFMVPHAKEHGHDLAFLVDHRGGQIDGQMYSTRFGSNEVPACEVLPIPKNCTSECQPCDTVFFRQLKYFLRRITEYVQLHDLDTVDQPIYSRESIQIIHSLLQYQLSATIFRPMIRYAWYKAGICNEKEPFLNVKQACFTFTAEKCELRSCLKKVFLLCSRCRKHICFECFFYDYHTPMNGCVDILEEEENISSQVSSISFDDQ